MEPQAGPASKTLKQKSPLPRIINLKVSSSEQSDLDELHPAVMTSADRRRSLKTQPIKGRLGEVFNHPDIASSRIEDLFADVVVSASTDCINKSINFSHNLSPALTGFTLAEVKQAWSSSKLFANRPMPRRSSSCYSPVLEIENLEADEVSAISLNTVEEESPKADTVEENPDISGNKGFQPNVGDLVGQPKKKSWLHFSPLVRLARMKKQLSIPIKDVAISGEPKVKEEAMNQKAVADKKVVKGARPTIDQNLLIRNNNERERVEDAKKSIAGWSHNFIQQARRRK